MFVSGALMVALVNDWAQGASSLAIEATRVVPESVPEWEIENWAETALP